MSWLHMLGGGTGDSGHFVDMSSLQTACFLAVHELHLKCAPTSEWSARCWPRDVRSSLVDVAPSLSGGAQVTRRQSAVLGGETVWVSSARLLKNFTYTELDLK